MLPSAAPTVSRFAVALAWPMIARLMLGGVCVAGITAGSGMVGAQPRQPRGLGPPPDLPPATRLPRAGQAAMRLLIPAPSAPPRPPAWPAGLPPAPPP